MNFSPLISPDTSHFKNIKAYIGPHIRQCCYEVSEELKEKFINKFNEIPCDKLFDGRNLSMELCIEDDLKKIGLNEQNIYSLIRNNILDKFSIKKQVGNY